MASKNPDSTVYLTEQEADRIRNTAEARIKKCSEVVGHAREPRDERGAISQATGAALMADMGSMTETQGSTLPALVVGQPYSPCTVPLHELQPMKVADLQLETHHRGRQLTVKRVSPVVTLTTRSWTMVQDEAGETERLEMVLHKSHHGEDILESTRAFALKEPYFTLTEEGEPTLRIDHPSDLILDPPTTTAATPPPDVEKRATSLKTKGNTALSSNNASLAHTHYTAALALNPSETLTRDLHRNRAHVNLLLAQYPAALADAEAALIPALADGPLDAPSTELNAKCYFRAGTAAYSLAQFSQARDFFATQHKLMPADKGAAANLARAEARIQEAKKGVYDFAKLRKGVAAGRVRVDIASYEGPTEVKESKGMGKGLFATRGLEKGEVVMVEKACCVVWGYEKDAITAVTYDVRDQRIRVAPVGLEKAVVARLKGNPGEIKRVMGLFGDWDGGEGKKVEGTEDGVVVDVFRVHDIVARNAFGVGSEKGGAGSAGLWVRAAYINHSCIPNTEREFIGDVMVVRATKAIAAGEEIVHSYDESGDYDARQRALMTTWGFECGCALCAVEKGEDPAVREKRQKLAEEADTLVRGPAGQKLAVVKAKRLVKKIEETYDEKKYKGLPRLAVRPLQEWIAKAAAGR